MDYYFFPNKFIKELTIDKDLFAEIKLKSKKEFLDPIKQELEIEVRQFQEKNIRILYLGGISTILFFVLGIIWVTDIIEFNLILFLLLFKSLVIGALTTPKLNNWLELRSHKSDTIKYYESIKYKIDNSKDFEFYDKNKALPASFFSISI